MPRCSVMTLCAAAISSMMSVAMVGIAFSTDNWQHIIVDQTLVGNETSIELGPADFRLYSRIQGIFRVCFPHENKPPKDAAGIYLNPIEEWCANVDYYVSLVDGSLLPDKLTYPGQVWFHVARSAVVAFCLYFMFTGIGCVTGLIACWRASGDQLVATAFLFILASLSGGGAMGLWHWAQLYEISKVLDDRMQFFQTWPEDLQEATTFAIGWSYVLAWVGLALTLVGSIMFSLAAIAMRQESKSLYGSNVTKRMARYPSEYDGLLRDAARSYEMSLIQGSHSEFAAYRYPKRPHSVDLSQYYSAGYPVEFEPSEKDAQTTFNFNKVVKELERNPIKKVP